MTCPICKRPLQERERYDGKRLACFCGWLEPEEVRQQKIPGDRGRQSRAITLTESEVEVQTDLVCSNHNWENLSTVHRVKFITIYCPRCVQQGRYTTVLARCHVCSFAFGKVRPVGKEAGYGVDPGVPDRLIFLPCLPPGLAQTEELKGTRGSFSSDAQKSLAERRKIWVSRSGEDVLRHARYVERILEPSVQRFCVDGRWPGLEELG